MKMNTENKTLKKCHFVEEVGSTNELAWNLIRNETVPEGFVVYTDFQTAGKGQLGNFWESERAKNLLLSIVLFPGKILPDEQFVISQLVSVALKKTLDNYCDGISIKWPNDIYWNDKKIGGILIENSLQGKSIRFSVIGIGLNVNQTEFVSNAPNPISLCQIIGKEIDRLPIQAHICENIMGLYQNVNLQEIHSEYSEMLYRKSGIYKFVADDTVFEASIAAVYPDGRLELETTDGERRSFYFKEVSFVID